LRSKGQGHLEQTFKNLFFRAYLFFKSGAIYVNGQIRSGPF